MAVIPIECSESKTHLDARGGVRALFADPHASAGAFELERYRTEQSLHRLRRVGGDPHECQSNSMNLSQRHAADAAPW